MLRLRKFWGMLALLCMLVLPSYCYAHSINGVDSTSAGKVIQYGSLTLTNGSASVSFSSGTVTCGIFMPDYTAGAGTTTTFKRKISGTTVTFYAYDDAGGTVTTGTIPGDYFIGK